MPTQEKTKKKSAQVRYTPAKPFRRSRFLLYMLTSIAVVLAILFGMAVFFRVADVNVEGAEKYSATEIMEASGVHKGDNLLTLSQTRISSRIMAKLPYVNTVRAQIKLPDTVNIAITESQVSYSVEASDGSWWLMTSRGAVTEQIQVPENYTKVVGIQLEAPQPGAMAAAYTPPKETTAEGESTEPEIVNPTQQLQSALEILTALEENGMLSGIATVDVSKPLSMEFWVGTQYEVTLGNNEKIAYKVELAKKAMAQMDSYQSGVLDVSFTIKPTEAVYTPFS